MKTFSEISILAGLHRRQLGWSQAAVLSVWAGVLLPDSPPAAAGNDWLTILRWDPKPPADVLFVGTVAQGGGLALLRGRRQRVPIQEDGLQ